MEQKPVDIVDFIKWGLNEMGVGITEINGRTVFYNKESFEADGIKTTDPLCRIYGVDKVSFSVFVPESDIGIACVDIWQHASKYSKFADDSEEAYYEFTKFLWVQYPDGREVRLSELANKVLKETKT